MQEAEKYLEYAAECRRFAEKAASGDKEVLLKIAKAWEEQARLAEVKKKRESR
jgi:hypothetical protein